MIRRDDGSGWLLISQVEHARLAAEIAEAWRNGKPTGCDPWGLPRVHPEGVPSLRDGPDAERQTTFAEELLSAVRHHDDGWAAWEAAPTVDPETGKPRDFREMPMEVATAIWERSIDRCAADSPWAGLWVSRHFCYLGERAREGRQEGSDELQALNRFLDSQAQRRSFWRQRLQEAPGDGAAGSAIAEREEAGYRWVQFFDRLSLWICCAERTESARFTTPAAQTVQLIPRAARTIAIAPPALSVASLKLSVPAKWLRARRFADDGQFQTALAKAREVALTWIVQGSS